MFLIIVVIDLIRLDKFADDVESNVLKPVKLSPSSEFLFRNERDFLRNEQATIRCETLCMTAALKVVPSSAPRVDRYLIEVEEEEPIIVSMCMYPFGLAGVLLQGM